MTWLAAFLALAAGGIQRPGPQPTGPGRPPVPTRGADPVRPTPGPRPQGRSPGASAPARAATAAPEASADATAFRPIVGSRVVAAGDLRVGDPFEIRVTVVHRPEVSVNLPAKLSLGQDLEVLGRRRADPERLDNGKVREEFTIRAVAFRTGRIELPAIEVVYSYPAGRTAATGSVETSPGAVEIKSLTANEANPDLKPEEGPVAVYVENRTAKYVAIGLAAALAGILLGLALYRLLRRRLRKPKPPPPPRPAHVVALEALDRLASSDMLDRGELREFVFSVSEVVRKYLGDRFGFESLELTTTELLEELRKVALVGITLEEVEAFSRDCDLVKFAKYVPSRKEAEDILAGAYDIVRKSKPGPLPVAQEPTGPSAPDGAGGPGPTGEEGS